MEIAHRIDRETSGVLLIARNRAVASFLTRAFARRAVEKTYLALVKGQPPDEGKIDLPLRLLDTQVARDDGAGPRGEPGLTAVTQFRVVRRLPGHALCEAQPADRTAASDPRALRQHRPPDRGRQALRRRRGPVHARLRRAADARAARLLRRAAAARAARAPPDLPASRRQAPGHRSRARCPPIWPPTSPA